jgi:hypothetical protein
MRWDRGESDARGDLEAKDDLRVFASYYSRLVALPTHVTDNPRKKATQQTEPTSLVPRLTNTSMIHLKEQGRQAGRLGH